MPKRIDKLTPEQEAQFKPYADKWIDYGLSTAPADRPRVEKGIRDCYRLAGLEQPKTIVWVPSPIVGAFAAPAAAFTIELIRGLRKDQKVRGAVDGAVDGAVGDAVHGALRNVWSQRWYLLMGGRLWSGWNAWRAFFVDICKLELSPEIREKYDAWMVAQSAGWWWPWKDFVMVCETPRTVARDERGRLHREDGPAVRFQDGWGIYAWHGVRVDERVINDPESYTAKEILAERNTEVVRALAEKLGWSRFLEKVGAKTLDTWRDPKTALSYELLDTQKSFGERQPLLLKKQSSVLNDGSQPFYVEQVPREITSAQAGRKWQAMAAFLDTSASEAERAELVKHCNKNPELSYQWEA